ncbi:MAG: flagellar brake protein [Bacillota bacterium]|nr:flagellar brake protein [Bacillota bacterium]
MADGLRIGQRIQIKTADSEDEWYSSRVEDLTGETVTIAAPIKAGAVVSLPPGTLLDCHFPRDDAFYAFQAEIIQRRHLPVPVLVLRRPETVQRFQRRRLFRLPVVLPVLFKVAGSGTVQKGSTLDLSGGGVCLVAPELLAVGTELELALDLPDGFHLAARGRVVKATECEGEKGPSRYAHGVEFLDLPLPVQERIVSFVFAEQRERRRREAGRW